MIAPQDGAVGRAIFQPSPSPPPSSESSDGYQGVEHHNSSDGPALPSNAPAPAPAAGQDVTLGQKMMSAVAGSILTSLLVTPLDVVRVRLQSQQQPSTAQATQAPSSATYTLRPISAGGSLPRAAAFANLPRNLGVTACCREVFWVSNNAGYCLVETNFPSSAAECAVEETERRTFTSTFDGIRKIARNEGLTTLWRGLSPTLMMAVPGNVIYFAGYDWLRTSARSPLHGRVSETYSPLVAGSSARVLAALVVSPIELFRTRMQASVATSAADNFRQTLAGVREMTATYGYRSLWRGLTLTFWRDVPFSALYWWGYESVRQTLLTTRAATPSSSPHHHSPGAKMTTTSTLIDSFIAGATSGAIASIVTTPFDVGKTRQQVYRQSSSSSSSSSAPTASTGASTTGGVTSSIGNSSSGGVERLPAGTVGVISPENKSMPKFLWHIFRTEGLPGLFRGWIPRALKVAPACAIMISSYELGKRMALGVNEGGASGADE